MNFKLLKRFKPVEWWTRHDTTCLGWDLWELATSRRPGNGNVGKATEKKYARDVDDLVTHWQDQAGTTVTLWLLLQVPGPSSSHSLDLQTAIFETRDFSGPLRCWISRKSAPVICDFGQARTRIHIQPAAYRAPEIFLYLPWGTPVDILYFGCMVDYHHCLFSPLVLIRRHGDGTLVRSTLLHPARWTWQESARYSIWTTSAKRLRLH